MNKTFLFLFFSAGLSVSAVSAREDQVAGITFGHKDWVLVCDNTRTCRAAGYHAEDDYEHQISVLLIRKAGATQPVKAAVQVLTKDEAEEEAPLKSLQLLLNGRDLGRVAIQSTPAVTDDSGNYNDMDFALSSAQTTALLAALPHKSRIVFSDDKGNQWTLSDEGATAVLLKMDEFQGRLGTTGALVGKGAKDESGVLPALAAPVVRVPALAATSKADKRLADNPALRKALLDLLGTNDGDCDRLSAPQPDDEENKLIVTRLSKDKLLVSALCWRGAYNEGSGHWVVNNKPPYKPELVTVLASDYGDATDGTISATQKARGIGDCWMIKEWAWNGAHFVQTRDARTGLCRGFAGGAWTLPTLVSDVHHVK